MSVICSGRRLTRPSTLLRSFTAKAEKPEPPIKPWPPQLTPQDLVPMLQIQSLNLALRIFYHAGQHHPGFTHTYDTYKTIIDRLCIARAFPAVETLLTELRMSQIKCYEGLFANVIRKYGIACRPDMAYKTFLRISGEFRVRTTLRSFNTLLNVFIHSKDFDSVYRLFENCREKYDIVPNLVTCNLLIKALCKRGDVEAAVGILDQIPQMGMVPNLITYTTVLGGFVARGDMRAARRVFDEILDRGLRPDVVTYTIFLDGLVKIGRLDDAIKMMDEMENNRVIPSEVTYGAMIQGFCKAKKLGEAMNLLYEMVEKKHIPSSTLCCRLIDVLCEQGKVQDACNLGKKLLTKDVILDNEVLSTLIHWLCDEGKVKEARSLFNEFHRSSVPSLLTYNTLIAGMCENEEFCEARKLWDDMVENGCEPNAFTYNMLIKGMCKCGDAKVAVKFLEEMFDKGCLPNKLTSSILIKRLCDSGCEADLQRVLYLVASKGQEIGTDCWADVVTKFISDVDNPGVVLDRVLIKNVI